MPVPDIPTFLAKLKQSRLLDEPQLEQVEVCAAAESDPKELAKRLLRDGFLTKWQAIQLLSGRSSLGLGPYRFLEQLDSDEETLCFSARKIGSERKLLVRVLPPDKAPSKAHLVRFLNRTQQIATQPGHELVDSHTAKGGSDYSYAVIAISQVKEGEIPPKATAAVPLAAAAPPRKKPPRESDGDGPASGSSTADTPAEDTPRKTPRGRHPRGRHPRGRHPRGRCAEDRTACAGKDRETPAEACFLRLGADHRSVAR